MLINNAGGVCAARLEERFEAAMRAMIEVDPLNPILLIGMALPDLRQSGQGLIVKVTFGIALIGLFPRAIYASAKARLAQFGKTLRRELKGEDIQVVTACPGATDISMTARSQARPELGPNREPASAAAAAIVDGIERGAFEVVRGGETRTKIIALDWNDLNALDERFLDLSRCWKQQSEITMRFEAHS